MEQLNSSRLRRRSVRNLRRSSSFFGDSYTSSEVEQEEAPLDDEVASTYGSIWVEDGSKEKDSFQQIVNCSEEQLVCGDVGSCVVSKCLDDPKMLPVFSSYSGLTNKLLDSHNPVILDGCLTQCDPRMPCGSFGDSISPSIDHVGRQLVQEQELCNQQTPQLDKAADCGNETRPHIRVGSVSAYNSTSHLHDGIHQDKAFSFQNDIFSPFVLNIYFEHTSGSKLEINLCDEESLSAFTDNTKKINTEACDDKLGGNFETLSTNRKYTSLNKEARTNFTGKLQTSELNTDNIISAESRKDRRKSESDVLKTDISTHPDYEPKKRKRLSLRKTQSKIVDERECTFVGSHIEKDIELKHNEHIVSEVLQETNINVVGVNVCMSELKDTKKGTENSDKLMDLEISEEMLTNFDAELHLLGREKVATKKKNKQSKAKATRRSSRYFNLCEMPLSDFSLEQIPDVQLFSPGIKDFVVDARSSKFSSCEENKENTPEKQLNAPRKSWSLEDNSHELLESTIKLDDSQILDVAFIEEVVDDFANLCVNEKTCTDIAGLSLQTRRRRDGKRHSGAYTTIDSPSSCCQETDENKNCARTNWQQNDIPEQDISLQSALECSNNSPSGTIVKCDLGIFDSKSENIFNGTGDNTEKEQPNLYLFSSTSNDDVDMDELPSLGSPSARDEFPPIVNSESKMCMRVRRSRKSWGMCQQSGSNEKKKTPRQATKQKKSEKQSVQKLVTDNSQSSTSMDDAKVSSQSSDIQDISCATNKSMSSSDDEDSNVSPGLLCLYKNKNFVMPQPRSWETIKESPKSGKQIFSKQRRKCFMEFENGRTNAKLQRRHKKASDIYKKIGGKPVAVTNEEFERKMLDAQLFVESL